MTAWSTEQLAAWDRAQALAKLHDLEDAWHYICEETRDRRRRRRAMRVIQRLEISRWLARCCRAT